MNADISTGSAKRVLDELIALKIVERIAREEKTDGDKRADSYKISDDWIESILDLRGEKLRGGFPRDSTTDIENNTIKEKKNIFNRKVPPVISKGIGGMEESLFQADEQDKAQEDHFCDVATKPKATDPITIRIVAKDGYMTQEPTSDDPKKWVNHLYEVGDVFDRERWKAADLVKRGIAAYAGTGI
jgi:hypothetical protein